MAWDSCCIFKTCALIISSRCWWSSCVDFTLLDNLASDCLITNSSLRFKACCLRSAPACLASSAKIWNCSKLQFYYREMINLPWVTLFFSDLDTICWVVVVEEDDDIVWDMDWDMDCWDIAMLETDFLLVDCVVVWEDSAAIDSNLALAALVVSLVCFSFAKNFSTMAFWWVSLSLLSLKWSSNNPISSCMYVQKWTYLLAFGAA